MLEGKLCYGIYHIILPPTPSMADLVPCDRLLQKAYKNDTELRLRKTFPERKVGRNFSVVFTSYLIGRFFVEGRGRGRGEEGE